MIRRALYGVAAVVIASIMAFMAIRLTGDPVLYYLPQTATQADVERIREQLGLNEPIPVQYGRYAVALVQGDFGRSVRTNQPVSDVLFARMWNSIKLATVSLVLAGVAALPLGIIGALRRHRHGASDAVSRFVSSLAVVGQSVPVFWSAVLMILLFSVTLGWLPVAGSGTWKHYVMPSASLAAFLLAGLVRLIRSSLLEALGAPYVITARSKGLKQSRVIGIHALRNALIPTVTFAGTYFVLLLGSAVVVETIFNWPGVGSLAYTAVRNRDLPMMQGVLILLVGAAVLVNMLVDVLYTYIDPRIRLSS